MKKIFTLILLLSTQVVFSQSWKAVTNPTNERINDCSFIDENVGWIVTDLEIFKTIDGAITWKSQDVPPNPITDKTRVMGRVHFLNENIGIISCGTYLIEDGSLASPILWTINGGETWENRDIGNPFFNLDAILVDENIAYSIGQYGAAKKTVDGGNTWDEISYPGGYSGNKLFPISKDTIYFVGLHQFDLVGAFGKTTNGGIDWEIQSLDINGLTKAIYFHDAKHGCIGGFYGDIRCTEDGGTTWTVSESGTSGIVNYFSFTDHMNGWAVTSEGEILKTNNGGKVWTEEHKVNSNLNAISITKPNNVGYAVGLDDVLKTTTLANLEGQESNLTITAYPNPFLDNITIQRSHSRSSVVQIEIYDILGRLVLEQKLTGSENEIPTSVLASGTYILKTVEKGQLEIQTIIKQ